MRYFPSQQINNRHPLPRPLLRVLTLRRCLNKVVGIGLQKTEAAEQTFSAQRPTCLMGNQPPPGWATSGDALKLGFLYFCSKHTLPEPAPSQTWSMNEELICWGTYPPTKVWTMAAQIQKHQWLWCRASTLALDTSSSSLFSLLNRLLILSLSMKLNMWLEN